ncbi:hypothetical protein KSS87_000633, partial [Heliosperma pusillum]
MRLLSNLGKKGTRHYCSPHFTRATGGNKTKAPGLGAQSSLSSG